MPQKGKLPEWEKIDNRKKLLMLLLQEPLTFNELQAKTDFSPATLTKHLIDLEKSGLIQRIRKNKKRVYQVVLDKEKIAEEVKSFHYDLLLEFFRSIPELAELTEIVDCWFKALVEEFYYLKKREIEGKPRLSSKELLIKTLEIIRDTQTPKVRELTRTNEILNHLKSKPESDFSELERLRGKFERKKEKKKHEG